MPLEQSASWLKLCPPCFWALSSLVVETELAEMAAMAEVDKDKERVAAAEVVTAEVVMTTLRTRTAMTAKTRQKKDA